MSNVSVADAAAQLRVSPQRIRAMLKAGVLNGEHVAGRWLVDASSMPSIARRAGQPFSPRVAWGLVSIADGERPAELSQPEVSRLRSRWRSLIESAEPVVALHSLMLRRAERSRWSAPDPRGLLDDDRFIPSGKSDPRSGMAALEYAEGYVHDSVIDDLIADHMLVPARGPENVIFRKIERSLSAPVPEILVAADLADGDAREVQQAGLLLEKIARRG